MEFARRVLGERQGEAPVLNRPELVFSYFQSIATGLTVEKLWVLCLNRKNRLIKCVEVTSGTATGSLVHPREVFRSAIREAATSVICRVRRAGFTAPPPLRTGLDSLPIIRLKPLRSPATRSRFAQRILTVGTELSWDQPA